MKTFLRMLLVVLIVMCAQGAVSHAQTGDSFPRTVTDGLGNKVTLTARPIHIVSVTLGTDEILLSLVDPARIVAITANALDSEQSNIVEQAKRISVRLTTADPETIIALRPDLVFVASYTDAGVIKQLKDAGLTVFVLGNFSSIKDIENNITLLGQVVGEEGQAATIVNGMETRLKAIASAVKGAKPLTVLYYGPEGYSDGAGSTVDDVITHAGGLNLLTVAGIKDTYPQVNDEFVVQQDPDVILVAGLTQYSPGFADKFYKNPNFQTLKAVKNKRAVVINDAHVDTVSQYIVEGVSDVAALLYPDLYQPTPVATSVATLVATVTP
jgi:iron complex transport system substrate-binding protein